MRALVRDRRFTPLWFRNFFMIGLGSLIMAASYVFFIVPYRITPGGVFGLSIVIHYLTGLPTGVMALVINLPLLAWGARELGPRFSAKTILGLCLTSANIDLLTFFWGSDPVADNILVSSLFGGVTLGVGLALVFKAKATTGGFDILARILFKKTRFPLGRGLIAMDICVVAIGVLVVGDPSLALYSIVTIFAEGKTLDGALDGLNYQKAAFIVSKRYREIRNLIISEIGRGGTLIPALGMFSRENHPMILTVLSRRELAVLEEHVKRIDPEAFVIVFDSHEVLGQGFQPLAECDQ